MKYCPNCGTILTDGASSFCSECGKPLLNKMEESEKSLEPISKKGKKKKKGNCPEKMETISQDALQLEENTIPSEIDDGYDGYYNDVRPRDEGRQGEGIDKRLVKKIVLLIVGVIIVIGVCIAIMYLL